MMRLTSAATAYAECAWVLWQREVIAKRDIGWAPRESFKDISECKKKESKADMGYNADTQKLEPILGGHTVCLPDTGGPRGPRGSETDEPACRVRGVRR